MRTDLTARADIVEMFDLARRHGVDDLAASSALRGDTLAAFKTQLLKRLYVRQMGGAFSFARMVQGMEAGRIDGHRSRDAAGRRTRRWRALRPAARLHSLGGVHARPDERQRVLLAAILCLTEVGEAIDVLRPWSVTARAGITVLERLQGDVTLPRTSHEGDAATGCRPKARRSTESTPALGQIAMTPKTAGGLGRILAAAVAAGERREAYVRRELLRTIGSACRLRRVERLGRGRSSRPAS